MFEIGERILCIDAFMQPNTREELEKDMPNWVVKDEKYTIRSFTSNKGIVDGLWLEEIKNPHKYFRLIDRVQEGCFSVFRFKKIDLSEIKKENTEKVEDLKLIY